MAELIDKGALREVLDNTGKVGMSHLMIDNIIRSMPTTTEAEIRAKAIDEFAEAVILEFECFAREQDGEPNAGFISMCIDIVRAEQLKEE